MSLTWIGSMQPHYTFKINIVPSPTIECAIDTLETEFHCWLFTPFQGYMVFRIFSWERMFVFHILIEWLQKPSFHLA